VLASDTSQEWLGSEEQQTISCEISLSGHPWWIKSCTSIR